MLAAVAHQKIFPMAVSDMDGFNRDLMFTACATTDALHEVLPDNDVRDINHVRLSII